MMLFWIGLIIGFFGGGIIGVLIMASLCVAAKSDLDENDKQDSFR